MNEKEFYENADHRWEILSEKVDRYGEHSWRNMSKHTALKLGLHRLEEVLMQFNDNGFVDIDNLIDAMNFCDFVLRKELEVE